MDAYFDCFSGISGNMTLGALIDLGAPVDRLSADLSRLEDVDFELEVTTVERHGIAARHVDVRFEEKQDHRHFPEIVDRIRSAPFSATVKTLSEAIFRKIAEAEAKIHGCTMEQVHFHEVGAVDAIVDIVGTALCLEYLEIDRVAASRIALGRGLGRCQHGVMPVPPPATLEILKGAPVQGTSVPHELTTPTGAAIIATLSEQFGDLPDMTITAVGYGAGTRSLKDRPNLLRVLVGDFSPEATTDRAAHPIASDRVMILESAVDDMNPEILGYLMETLFEDGALDVLWIPVFMKKNRPGTLIQVLCRETDQGRIADRIFSETTVTGIRMMPANRQVLFRESVDVTTDMGTVRAKRIVGPDGAPRLVPEFEECRRFARERGLSIRDVYDRLYRELADR